jgi:hypothetical protein|tara:strand:- start:474 stop:806 length:333 start_codon:yes stop_codon:yes gene_type:complete
MVWKILGQLRPTNTTAASLFSPTRGHEYRIDVIYVSEHAGATPTYRLFFDDDGTTYDQTTAIAYDLALSANQSKRVEGPFYMNNASGNIGVRTSAGSQITFTAFGEELKT